MRTLPLGQTEKAVYDDAGLIRQVTDFSGDVTFFEFDDRLRPIKATNADGVILEERTYSDNVLQVTAAGGVTTVNYSDGSFLGSWQGIEGTLVEYSRQTGVFSAVTTDAGTTRFEYDSLGQLASLIDVNNAPIVITHDLFGYPVLSKFADGSQLEKSFDAEGRTRASHFVRLRTNCYSKSIIFAT